MSNVASLAPSPALHMNPILPLVRAPGQLIHPQGVVFLKTEAFIRRHAGQLLRARNDDKSARFALVDGAPGTGKTHGITDGLLRAGFAAARISPASLAGEHENSAVEVLTDLLEGAVAYSKATGHNISLVVDDAHLSIFGSTDPKLGKTVNSNLIAAELQRLCDRPYPYRCATGMAIPIYFSGNDFTETLPSLFRDGRANRFTHKPAPRETVGVIYAVLEPQTREEMHTFEKLVKAHHRQPIAFWVALRDDLMGHTIDDAIPQGPLTTDAVDAAYATHRPLENPNALTLADERASNAIVNHYATDKPRGFPWR